MVQKIPREEQLRRELEIIDDAEAVLERLMQEQERSEQTMQPHTMDYQIQMATVRLGINASRKHIKAHMQSLETIQAAMEREDKNE